MSRFTEAHNDCLDPDLRDLHFSDNKQQPKRGYQIAWHNPHASGVFDEVFTSKRKAESWGRAWKRDMVAMEDSPRTRKEARADYEWEVITANP